MTTLQTGVSSAASSFNSARGTLANDFADVPWTGTWGAAMQDSGQTFANQTLRQIVHTSIGGSAARIRLSNRYGAQPVTLSDIHIAESAGGAGIKASTDTKLTFGGTASVTIPAGGEVVSDSATLSVGPESNLAVSLYVPGTATATRHTSAHQQNWYGTGNQTGASSIADPGGTTSYSFLSGLEVQSSSAVGSVVAFGASITDGDNSGTGSNTRWPNLLAARLNRAGYRIGVINAGISGNNILQDGGGEKALTRFGRDALDQPGVRWVIFSDDALNDLNNSSPSVGSLTDALGRLIAQAHERNVKFFCSTLTPVVGTAGWNSEKEAKREAINDWLRSPQSGCDGIVDQATATADPRDRTRYLPAYDSGDHLHPNDAGMEAIANSVPLDLFGSPTENPVGLPPALPALSNAFNNVAVSSDGDTRVEGIDGDGASYSAQALNEVGLVAGHAVEYGGVTFTWPNTAGTKAADNVVSYGQTIAVRGSGTTLGFLLAGTYGRATGTGTVNYADGTQQVFTLSAPDWYGDSTGSDAIVATAAYQNRPDGNRFNVPANVHFAGITLQQGKTVASVTLPKISDTAVPHQQSMHIFAMEVAAQPLKAFFNNVAVSSDGDTRVEGIDGDGASYSAQALNEVGLVAGHAVEYGGVTFTWPNTAGTKAADNVVSYGQTIAVRGSGTTLGFLLAGTYGRATGTGTVNYADGTQQVFTLSAPDWYGDSTGSDAIVATAAYQNRPDGNRFNVPANVHFAGITLQQGKTVASVTLPKISDTAVPHQQSMHIFAVSAEARTRKG
ncbi:SGNH/GDSL hydrolase family protein [Streptomyces sp. NPDC026673]|uniref:SGNH/GDSL hydrolase family protein n=1 Tax=Streptomyces sp. NPDC026673 TaxID=3155724 RepID=UPI0033D0111A